MSQPKIPLSRRSVSNWYAYLHTPAVQVDAAFDRNKPSGFDVVDYQPIRGSTVGKADGTAVRKGDDTLDTTFNNEYDFKWYNMIFGIVSILFIAGDIFSDIYFALQYFQDGQTVFGIVTIILVAGPSLVVCCLGLSWYAIDYKSETGAICKQRNTKDKYWKPEHETPKWLWILRCVFTVLQLGIFMRTFEYLYYGWKSMRSNKNTSQHEKFKYHIMVLREDVDACMLHMFESFLEAAPQLTFQLFVLATQKPEEDVVMLSFRILQLVTSWGSLSISLLSYHRTLRYSRPQKKNMSLKAVPIYFTWRACEVGGRILCFSLFAIVFKLWIFLPIFFHWILVTVWIVKQKTEFYEIFCLEKIFNIICGYAMIFCFLNLREGHTRFRYMVYYVVFYMENACLFGVWLYYTPSNGGWYNVPFVLIIVLSALHILIQLIYYKFFHPQDIASCLPCSRDICFESVCFKTSDDNNKAETIVVQNSDTRL